MKMPKARYWIAALVIIIIIAAAAGSSGSGSKGPTNSPALVTTGGSGTSAPAHKAATGKPQTFRGNGSENLGTIDVPTQSTLRWRCQSCANSNFVITNSFNDPGTIDVNALGPTSGKTAMDAGTYHDVSVNTEGRGWTITIAPR